MTSSYSPLTTRLHLLALASAMLALASCTSSNNGLKGVPSNLPTIPLYDSAVTPPHSMPHSDYPFSPGGDYVTSWAAEGGVRPDLGSSRGSHHGDEGSSSRTRSKSKATPVKSKTSSSKSKSSSSGSGRAHTVKSSDTLSSIARKYGTTVAKLKSLNGLSSNVIRDGRKLKIP
jgi:LysM domain